jgi:hypothetical protein
MARGYPSDTVEQPAWGEGGAPDAVDVLGFKERQPLLTYHRDCQDSADL